MSMTQTPIPDDGELHVVSGSGPRPKIIYSIESEPQLPAKLSTKKPQQARRFLPSLAICLGLAIFAAGIIYWARAPDFPVVVAISPPDRRAKDPLGEQGALIPLSPGLLHVTSIALGNPSLTIVNGKQLTEEDWLVVKTPVGEASVQVISIQDGFVRFKHGGETIEAHM